MITWRDLPRLRDPDRFDAWLQRTLVHACYGEARRKRAWITAIRTLPVDGPAGPDELASLADHDEVERGFRRLPPEQRAILVLHHDLGLGLNEIGEVFDIPPGTARSRLHYAHRAMRALLEADARPTAVAGGPPFPGDAGRPSRILGWHNALSQPMAAFLSPGTPSTVAGTVYVAAIWRSETTRPCRRGEGRRDCSKRSFRP